MASDWTKTEECIWSVLADGLPHTRDELRRCLPDDLGANVNLQVHISNIRRKLPAHELIVCEVGNHPIRYRRVRMIRNRNARKS